MDCKWVGQKLGDGTLSIMHLSKTRIGLRFLGLAFIALLTWVAWGLSQPPLERPNVSVKLLGYTNDVSGNRLAMITVTNLSDSTIFVYMPIIEIPDPTERWGYAWADGQTHGSLTSWHSMLNRDASGNLTIPPPTNQSPWRISFFVYNDVGMRQVAKRLITGEARRHPYGIKSDWFDSGK